MKILTYIILAIIGYAIVCKLTDSRLNSYNRHICAVYGYFEDCKTKLPEDQKLK